MMPDYEVFVQLRRDKPFAHVGSVRAPNDELGLQAAKEVYTRRDKPTGLWVVDRRHIVSANPADQDLFQLAHSKEYRRPSYFTRGRSAAKKAPDVANPTGE